MYISGPRVLSLDAFQLRVAELDVTFVAVIFCTAVGFWVSMLGPVGTFIQNSKFSEKSKILPEAITVLPSMSENEPLPPEQQRPSASRSLKLNLCHPLPEIVMVSVIVVLA